MNRSQMNAIIRETTRWIVWRYFLGIKARPAANDNAEAA